MHHVGKRTIVAFIIFGILILGVAIDLRLSLSKLPEHLGSVIERAIKENTVQKLTTTFKEDIDPGEGVITITHTVETPRNAGESAADWHARHNEAVEVFKAGKTIVSS